LASRVFFVRTHIQTFFSKSKTTSENRQPTSDNIVYYCAINTTRALISLFMIAQLKGLLFSVVIDVSTDIFLDWRGLFMQIKQTNPYIALFQHSAFRKFWLGFTFSAMGDSLTKVALVWFVYQSTQSPQALGGLLLCYTGPVILGGWLAGILLDRFNPRTVMLVNNLFCGLAIALIPLLSQLGLLALWQIYCVASIYGLLQMITMAGSPTLIPAFVSHEHLATANALETLSYTVSGALGPPLAGFLIAWSGAPAVLVIDALSYFAFALALLQLHGPPPPSTSLLTSAQTYRFQDAILLLARNNILLTTTLMFMTFNIGEGFLLIWLPIFADQILKGGSEWYGILLSALAVGEIGGTFLAGGITPGRSLGKLICLMQLLSGLSLLLVLSGQNVWWAIPGLILLGTFSAPLTIWAQTLRMHIIPEQLRGRTFALLRTLMQGTSPLGSSLAGILIPLLGMPAMIALSAFLIGAPALVGYQVKDLRSIASDKMRKEE
jgi:MFS family permease